MVFKLLSILYEFFNKLEAAQNHHYDTINNIDFELYFFPRKQFCRCINASEPILAPYSEDKDRFSSSDLVCEIDKRVDGLS